MQLGMIDNVIEISDDSIVAEKTLTGTEDYLQDHFPTFPVLPGVMMLEAMTEAARLILVRLDPGAHRHVLASVRALKFGGMVRPGQTLRVELDLLGSDEDSSHSFKAVGSVIDADEQRVVVSGRIILRPIRLAGIQSESASPARQA